MSECIRSGYGNEIARMKADAVLASDIHPECEFAEEPPRVALLTGACGFLGRHVALELLRNTDLRLVCLVRDKANETAAARVARGFVSAGISRKELAERVTIIVGDLTEPGLGTDDDIYADLAKNVDVIYHCAARVDWVRDYGRLYRVNVASVLHLIRFACLRRTKRLVFVSSIAVCYAYGGPARIDEDSDMLPYIGGMPLGYARSKCVAESLLRQAAMRGVPVTILRPGLIAGDSVSGTSNPADLIAALIQACVITGVALDADWLLDCVPVDFVARVTARIPQGSKRLQVLNLIHEQPRHWRELVLWMNLHGYPVDLVGSDAWIRQLFDETHGRSTMLYAQRQFFCGRRTRYGSPERSKPYEAYLAQSQRQISSDQTRTLLNQIGLKEAPLDADRLHAYFDYYRLTGVLPPHEAQNIDGWQLDQLLSLGWRQCSGFADIRHWKATEMERIGSSDGLLSEIAAARVKEGAGIWRLHIPELESADAKAVLKAKVSDQLLIELTTKLAAVCRPKLGALFRQYPDALGLNHSQERELVLYERDEPRLRRHMPVCFGTLRDTDSGRWAMLLEYLPETEVGKPAVDPGSTDMKVVLNGLAEIHAVWFRREKQLLAEPWLAATPDTARMEEMTPLWLELADFAAPWYQAWCGVEIRALQTDFVATLPTWWPRLRALPSTLTHNDFNPRNFVLRRVDGRPRLCVYDWELAGLGLPQHDLAELLCFTWRGELMEQDLGVIVDGYRDALSAASGWEIDLSEWREGFAFALRHLLVNRLSMYTLMHRFRPLNYLPKVLANWMRLYSLSRSWYPADEAICQQNGEIKTSTSVY